MWITFIDVRFCNVHIIGPINVCLYDFRFKGYDPTFILYVLCDLDHYPMSYNRIAKFQKNPSSIDVLYSCGHTHKHTQTNTRRM